MKIRNSMLFCFAGFFLIACGGGDSAPPSTTTCNGEINLAAPVASPAITVKFTVTNLPETLPINQANTTVGVDEYSWSVLFDIDASDSRSAGDLSFRLSHIRRIGNQAMDCALGNFDSGLIEHTSNTRGIQTVNGAVEVSGNIITLSIPKSQHEFLNKITEDTKVQFSTTSHDGAGQAYRDAYPGNESISKFEVISDGLFTDIDVDEPLGVDLGHIDMQTMEVIVN